MSVSLDQFYYSFLIHVVVTNFSKILCGISYYLSGGLGWSGGDGGKPGRRDPGGAGFGTWPAWTKGEFIPLPNGTFNRGPFPLSGGLCGSLSGFRKPGLCGRLIKLPGACSVSEVSSVTSRSSGCRPPCSREFRAKEHCVLQILSLPTASTPNLFISWGQLLILSDWHCA